MTEKGLNMWHLAPTYEFGKFLDSDEVAVKIGQRLVARIPALDCGGMEYSDRFEILVGFRARGYVAGKGNAEFFFKCLGQEPKLEGVEVIALYDKSSNYCYRPSKDRESLWNLVDRYPDEDMWVVDDKPALKALREGVQAELDALLQDPERIEEAKKSVSDEQHQVEPYIEHLLAYDYARNGRFACAERPSISYEVHNWLYALMDYLIDSKSAARKLAEAYWHENLEEIGRSIVEREHRSRGVERFGDGIVRRLAVARSILDALDRLDCESVRLSFEFEGEEVQLVARRPSLVEELKKSVSFEVPFSVIRGKVPEGLHARHSFNGKVVRATAVDLSKLVAIRFRGRDVWTVEDSDC